jgi:Zn-dependent protease with chaperone function
VTGQPPPGWYPDPGERAFQRYWDGRAWTAATRGASQGPSASDAARTGLAPIPADLTAHGPRSALAAVPAQPHSASSPVPARTRAAATPHDGTTSLRLRGGQTTYSAGPALGSTIVALATLIPAAVGALTIVAPIAYGLHLIWPLWGATVPFAVWVAGAVLASWQQATILRKAYGYRDPTTEELRRLKEPARRALDRVGVSARRVRLLIVKSPELNAPATTGRLVVVTSYAASSLPPDRFEAVLAHELSHHAGLNAVPVFCYTHLTLPIRALWWLLTRIWRPVRRMWRVAVAWHTPFGFLVTFLLAVVAVVVILVSVFPAGVAFLGAALSRISTDQAEFHADAAVAGLGLGPQLLAALETAIEAGHGGTDRTGRLLALPPLAVRRAQRLRKNLVR